MNYANKKNVKHLYLSASSDSDFRIYEGLGFRVISTFDCYEKIR